MPTPEQERYFVRACGVARFAYNWGLAEWNRQYLAGEKCSDGKLRKQLNAIKRRDFPWMTEVTKNAPQQALKNLGSAFENYFNYLEKSRSESSPLRIRKPKFKKKGRRESFRADNGPDSRRPAGTPTDGKRVKLPIVGWVRMREQIRFSGPVLSVIVSRQADKWYASFTVRLDNCIPQQHDNRTVGLDLGISTFATLSNGSRKVVLRPMDDFRKKFRRLYRSLFRKSPGSRNRAKVRTKLARLHQRVTNIRRDSIHKITTELLEYGTIVIEDLTIKNLRANRRLSRAISEACFFEFRRQLRYKTKIVGINLIVASRWFPSSKICSACGAQNERLRLSDRWWRCFSCGSDHDRDLNAARNLKRYAESSPVSARRAAGAGRVHCSTKPVAWKQEGC